MHSCKIAIAAFFALTALLSRAGVLAAPWVEQGPGPILNGGSEGIPNNPVAGAINAIVPSPGSVDVVFVGTVSGRRLDDLQCNGCVSDLDGAHRFPTPGAADQFAGDEPG